jgi:predicted transcriptional regulator
MIDRLADQLEKESRDLRVLGTVLEHHPIGIVRIAETTGVPEHKARYSLRMLEKDGLVEATPQGAVPADGIEDRVTEINDGLEALSDRVDALSSTENADLPEAESATAE